MRSWLGVVCIVGLALTACAPPETSAQASLLPFPAGPQKPEQREHKLRVDYPLIPGSRGRAVKTMQKALVKLRFDPGTVDGRFGLMTQHAVFAYEKVAGLPLDGTVGRRQLRQILEAKPIRAPKHPGVEIFVDVDVGRQVLFEVDAGEVTKILPVSTGNGAYYQSNSGLAIASTPRGTFQIYSKIGDWRVGYLGAMYYPSYFYGGYAIHGSASVPPYPASHGCVRIPMHSTVGFYERNPSGTTVFVHD